MEYCSEPIGLTLIPSDYFLLVIGQPQQDYAKSGQNKNLVVIRNQLMIHLTQA
jgi:hypothetical protein